MVGEAIFEELDYECEARNTEEFSRVHSFLPGVKAPRVLWTHTTQKVLVTTWVKGLSPKQLVAILRQGSRAEETRESRDDASEGLAAGATEGVVEGAGEVLAVAADKDALERAAAMGSVPVGLSAAEEAEWARERLLRMVRLG